jgi:hypothetical protein
MLLLVAVLQDKNQSMLRYTTILRRGIAPAVFILVTLNFFEAHNICIPGKIQLSGHRLVLLVSPEHLYFRSR